MFVVVPLRAEFFFEFEYHHHKRPKMINRMISEANLFLLIQSMKPLEAGGATAWIGIKLPFSSTPPFKLAFRLGLELIVIISLLKIKISCLELIERKEREEKCEIKAFIGGKVVIL